MPKTAQQTNAKQRLLNFINEDTMQKYLFYILDNDMIFNVNVFYELDHFFKNWLHCSHFYIEGTIINRFTKLFIQCANDKNKCMDSHEKLHKTYHEYRKHCKNNKPLLDVKHDAPISYYEIPPDEVNLFVDFDEFAFCSYLTVTNIRDYLSQLFMAQPDYVKSDLDNIQHIWNRYVHKKPQMTFYEYIIHCIKKHGYFIRSGLRRLIHHAYNCFSYFDPYRQHHKEFEKRKHIVMFFHEQTYEQFAGTNMDKIFAEIYVTKCVYGFL